MNIIRILKNEALQPKSTIKNLMNVDLKLYSLPISLRKVLIHMKKHEISLIKSNFIDIFSYDQKYVFDINHCQVKILIHLIDFQNRPSFSSLAYKSKKDELEYMKEKGNELFKKERYYQANKVYHNAYHRFSYGDVFGNEGQRQKDDLIRKDVDLYRSLLELKYSIGFNFVNSCLKIGRLKKGNEASNELLSSINNSSFENEFISKVNDRRRKILYLKLRIMLLLKEVEGIEEGRELILKYKHENKEDYYKDSLFKEIEAEYDETIRNISMKQRGLYKKMFSN